MRKLSRNERKIFNEGKRAGYNEGYIQGLHDGNPFNIIAEKVNKVAADIRKTINNMDPETKARLIEEYNIKASEGEQ